MNGKSGGLSMADPISTIPDVLLRVNEPASLWEETGGVCTEGKPVCEERANECQPSSLCSHLIARAESLPKPAIMSTSVASAGIEAR